MRALIYTFSMMFLMLSCSSVDKLVRKGEYDDAFRKGISFFSSKKKRKTEEVKAFEKAYAILVDRDAAEISHLKWSNGPSHLGTIVRIYEGMDKRQTLLKTILPLVSEDGYSAFFEIRDYAVLVREARMDAAESYYVHGIEMLNEAVRKNDKNLARRAYHEFAKVESYHYNFKEVNLYKDKALSLGHKTILVDINNEFIGNPSHEINRLMWNYVLSRHDDDWHTFRFREEANEDGDVLVMLDLHNLNISPGLENNVHFTESKEILVKTDKWVEKKDSIEIEKIKEYYERVTAGLIETIREKRGFLDGGIRIYDVKKNRLVSEKPIHVTFHFSDRGMIYNGDPRALTEETKKRLDPTLDNFPEDDDVALFLVSEYKKVLRDEINRVKS